MGLWPGILGRPWGPHLEICTSHPSTHRVHSHPLLWTGRGEELYFFLPSVLEVWHSSSFSRVSCSPFTSAVKKVGVTSAERSSAPVSLHFRFSLLILIIQLLKLFWYPNLAEKLLLLLLSAFHAREAPQALSFWSAPWAPEKTHPHLLTPSTLLIFQLDQK